MSWYPVFEALKTHLADCDDLPCPLKIGAIVPVPASDEIRLIRGGYEPKTNIKDSVHRLTVFIESWVTESDDPDADDYASIAALEGQIVAAINAFGAGDQRVNGRRLQVRFGGVEPDGDMFRPLVGSRMTVFISWQ